LRISKAAIRISALQRKFLDYALIVIAGIPQCPRCLISSPVAIRSRLGFGLTLGFTLVYLSLIVLLPLAAVVFKTLALSYAQFWALVTAPRVVSSYKLSFGASLLAGGNQCRLRRCSWPGSLVRYPLPRQAQLVDAQVDLPFALPTAVAGIALTALYARQRLARQPAGAPGHQGRLHAPGRAGGAGVHRPALRRAHGAAHPRRPGHRSYEEAAA
jgi:hypothetical protein